MVRTAGPQRLVLASASPRRVELLAQVGIRPDEIVPADIDETPRSREMPGPLARRLALAKGQAVAEDEPGCWVLSADTVVAVGRRILGKPDTEKEAGRFLRLLSGRRHRVHGGVTVIAPDGRVSSRLVVTSVSFKRLAKAEIDAYLAGGEWQGKAGGYAIQGHAGAFVRSLTGSYFNVVGLPLYETCSLLQGSGFVLSPHPSSRKSQPENPTKSPA